MAVLSPSVFTEALTRNRERLNTKFIYARQMFPQLDSGVFSGCLTQMVQPVVLTMEDESEEVIDRVLEVLYDFSLDLIGKGYLGPKGKYPELLFAWEKLFCSASHLLRQDPRLFAGSVLNAVYNLSSLQEQRSKQWTELMQMLSGDCDTISLFLDAGKVAAWRCGLAHYRQAALEIAETLKPSILARILELPPEADPVAVLDAIKNDPWLTPAAALTKDSQQSQLKVARVLGTFRGFGGVMLRPPHVQLLDNEIFASDNENSYLVSADVFGGTLQRTADLSPSKQKKSQRAFIVDKHGTVAKDHYSSKIPELADSTSCASTESTLAVTIPRSHSVYIVALVQEL